MICNVTLLKTKLSPSNTRLFNSKDEQKSFFDSLAQNGVTFSNVGYNGSRLFRLKGVSSVLNLDGYNYVIVYFPNDNITYYSFIDKYSYVNDNTYDLHTTLDYIQTYMFDIKLYNTIVKQRTLPTFYRQHIIDGGYISKYLYYSNYYPYVGVEYKEWLKLYTYKENLNGGKYVKYLFATFKGISGFENGGYQNTGYFPIIFPVILNDDNSYTISAVKIDNKVITYSDYVSTRASELINVSIVDYIPNDVLTISYNTSSGYYETIFSTNYFTTITTSSKSYTYLTKVISETINKTVLTDLLTRSPYVNLQIMRQGSDPQIIDILDFETNSKNNITSIEVNLTISPIFPNDTIVKFNLIDKSTVFTIPALTTTLAFSISEWQNYYSTHTASVNDGLATKHAYDMEMINNKTAGQIVSATVSGVAGIAGGVVSQKSGDIIGSVSGMANEMIGSAVAYENAKLGLEQEKALLELQWNDIKSSPNRAFNSNVNDNAKLGIFKESTYIALKQPLQMGQIQYYHSRFGYEINIPIPDNSNIDGYLSVLNNEGKLSQGTKFDYVEYKGCVLFNGKIPQQSCRRIEQILEQGIYFWYIDDIGNYANNY